MSTELTIVGFVLAIFAGVLGFIELGRRIGIRRRSKQVSASSVGLATVEGSVFALLGLLIAFTFSGAASRFENRRQMIVSESNAIASAYGFLDVLPIASRDKLRDEFRRYLDLRVEFNRRLAGDVTDDPLLTRALDLQSEIWKDAVAACRDAPPQVTQVLLPALSEMSTRTNERLVVRRIHQPLLIFAVIALLAFACALLAGEDMAMFPQRRWIPSIAFAAMVSITMYVILDLEYPRDGLIRVDAIDSVLEEVRSSMK